MKLNKIISMCLIFILIICLLSATALAGDPTDVTQLFGGDLASINEGDSTDTKITGAIDSIIGLVQVAGTGIALIAVSLLGIKYMLASVEEKAEIKKYIVGIVIGAVLVFGGIEIAQLLANFSTEVLPTS